MKLSRLIDRLKLFNSFINNFIIPSLSWNLLYCDHKAKSFTMIKMIKKRKIQFLIFLFPFYLSACSQASEKQLFEIAGETMGTYYRVVIVSEQQINSEETQTSIEGVLAQINQQMSTYISDSEITIFNNNPSTDWVSISEDFAVVTKKAKEIHQQSQGKFDATIGPLIELWSFGAEHRPIMVPSELELSNISQSFGSDKLQVQDSPPALKKSVSSLRLDLSAIAKGFAVDKLTQLLVLKNHTDFLIDIGGELRSMGRNLEDQDWRVGIEKPDPSLRQSVQQVVSISDKSIATSGSYRNYFEQEGVRFSHIIDPDTGRPISHQLVSVSVIADDCMSADGYATTLMVLGPDQGYEFALQYGLAVYMIEKQGDEIIVKTTPNMQSFME